MIIIPARLASTRFPRKVLHPINGIPMIIHTAQRASQVDEVVIATDSEEVMKIAKQYGFDAVLTSKTHESGTDRVNEAATLLGLDAKEIIINVQADEPLIEPQVIKKVKELTIKHTKSCEIMLCSAYKKISFDATNDPNSVKVVLDASDKALYFSRSQIPYPRSDVKTINIHLGIYGYTKEMLQKFCTLPTAPLEQIEKLEQLRALYHGYRIAMVEVTSQSIGIDTPEDLKKINASFFE
ncbi:3-deoxy-manno-octulosonate cytidylyltransferase [Nitratiruptor sp. SB155-2]|uniref:3-deoxy-manno-octulosonate cytidylyltransferase n=1 Tax=Nitratiruptor sp. (strain SB155-2) TaxID=387092 RepID=KDSB_NITSB|nr:3-deoxy-manno-octulosonate cytidylyltransferase [Nitratiruptor sp. SB155-2]A6Q3P4.1 RecName: Full=3-deoxy-manno-octulosonate cytidylyltransferase; AltName: Full=CMP-2-keto-3-deoxyoctulosonic acid synthase; Short=CKS; Short=CMP-KDO synthase [Nitratiruptor sp. SB155-2]BAF70103.1 3-deoxy-D-manno-octulosonate cytidylyltransferase [Nitratiruptor sp. SB155-2]